MKNITILGSTGSVGTQTLEVIKNLNMNVVALTTNTNIELLEKQIEIFKPKLVCVYNKEKAEILKNKLNNENLIIVNGTEGLIRAATYSDADIVVTAVVGIVGLIPTVEAIKAKKTIALANKETLVCAGELILKLAKENDVQILPVDSEHSAIFQCLKSGKIDEVKNIYLTASGGPFRKFKNLDNIKKEDALKHPTWNMGKKITIDSATLMNKALEYIEAYYLFNKCEIEVLVHPQSIVHSMVCFKDGSVIAQCSSPDMKLPISYALTYPNRIETNIKNHDFTLMDLTFENLNEELFPSIKLAKEVILKGGNMPCVLNSANELAVELFLKDEISFTDIFKCIRFAINNVPFLKEVTIENITLTDKLSREAVINYFR